MTITLQIPPTRLSLAATWLLLFGLLCFVIVRRIQVGDRLASPVGAQRDIPGYKFRQRSSDRTLRTVTTCWGKIWRGRADFD